MWKIRMAMLCFCLLFIIGFNLSNGQAAPGYTERVFIAGYGQVVVVDPAVPKVVTSISVKGPARDMSFTADGKKAIVNANGRTTLYVVDTVELKVIDEINLTARTDNGLLDRRVWGTAISPDGTKAYAFVTQGEKGRNKFKVLPSKILEIDLKTKEVVRSVEAPYGVHVLQFKPDDPNTVLVWGYDLYTLDVKTMTLKLKQGIKNPEKPENGSGNYLLIWPRDRESGFNAFPLIKVYPDGRVTEGLMWYNFKTDQLKSVEFDRDPVGMFSAIVDPEEKYGFVVLNHWYKVDLKTGKVLKDARPPTGSTYAINISADGQKIYLGAGGNTFVVADKNLKVQKAIDLPSDGWDMRVIRIQK